LHKSISVTTTALTPRSPAAVKFRRTKSKTRQDQGKITAHVIKLLYCCAAVG